MENNKLFRKNFFWNTLGSLVLSFTSLIFMIIVTRINGLELSGIFTYAFSIGSLLFTVGSYSGKVFQVTETDDNINDSDYIYSRLITCIIMNIIAFLICFILKFDRFKSAIIIILVAYRSIDAFSEVFYSILQRNGELYKAGKSMFFKTIFLVLCFYLLDLNTNNLIFATITLIIVNLLFQIFYDFKSSKKYFEFNKFSISNNNLLLKSGFYMFLYSFFSIFVINIPRYILDFTDTIVNQGIFGIIIMPASFMAMASLYVIHPFLNNITEKIKNNKYDELYKLVKKLLFIILIIGIISLLVCYFLGVPVLQFIYGIDLSSHRYNLTIIILGSIFYSIIVFLSSVLVAMRYTKEQVIILIIVSIISVLTGYFLITNYSITGGSISYFLVMLIQAIIYISFTFKKISNKIKGV